MDQVDRYVSPDGQRIALLNNRTGEVWVMRRQAPAEVADLMTLLPRWSRLRPLPASTSLPARPPLRVVR